MRRVLKALTWVSAGLFGLWALYAGIAYVLLDSERVRATLRRDEASVHFEYRSARSWVPGTVLVTDLVLGARHASGIKWVATFDAARLNFDLLALLRREIALDAAEGRGATVKLHSRRSSPKLNALRPPLPDAKVKQPRPPEAKGETGAWSVRLDDLRVASLRDVWLDEYHYQGDARLGGALAFAKNAQVTSAAGKVELTGGKLVVGTAHTAAVETLAFALDLGAFAPATVTADALLAQLTARLHGTTAIDSIDFLNSYFGSSSLRLQGGGTIAVDLATAAGRLTDGSFLDVTSEALGATFLGVPVRGSGRAKLAARGDGEAATLLASVRFDQYSVGDDGSAITGEGVAAELELGQVDVGRVPDTWHLRVSLPRAVVHEVAYLAPLLPRGTGVRILGGSGSVEGELVASSSRSQADTGRLHVTASTVELRFEDDVYSASAEVLLKLNAADLERRLFDASGSEVTLDDVRLKGNAKAPAPWSGRAVATKAELVVQDPVRFTGSLAATTSNLQPLISLYAAAEDLPGWAAGLLTSTMAEPVAIAGDVTIDDASLAIDDARLRSKSLTLDGWYRRQGRFRQGALLVDLGRLSIGLGVLGDEHDIQVIRAARWYAAQKPRPPR